ncbi:hypothetical protein JCM3765_002035 [Sporobolomyces pararoseus]
MSSSIESSTTPRSLSTPAAPFSSLSPSSSTLQALDGSLPELKASQEVEEQLRNICRYRSTEEADGTPLSSVPKTRLASVLVLLYLSPDGQELRATLTTRSKRMRSHPGETALPGGKFESLSDKTIEETALREANEEISLPLATPLLHLTNLAPYTSRTLLIVVPCVYLLLLPPDQASPWLKDQLKPSPEEVEAIFDCSLSKLLHLEGSSSTTTPKTRSNSKRTERERYDYAYTDYSWPLSPTTTYRLHSFSSPSPSQFPSSITGLTADILIDTASIAHFGPERGLEETERVGFERRAEGQESWKEICRRALKIQWKKGDPGRGVEVLGNGSGKKEVGLQ